MSAAEPPRSSSVAGNAGGRPQLAAALAYDPARDHAPRLVAAGRGPVAETIIAIAARHGIAVRENEALAEVLSRLDLGCEIPVALYAAVAEILAYLHRAGATAATGPAEETPR